MNQKNIIIIVIVALVVGVGSFYAGMTYQKSKNGAQLLRRAGGGQMAGGERMMGQGRTGQGRMQGDGLGRGGQNGDFIAGEIISKDDQSVTVKTMDGGSKIIYFSDSTSIGKSIDGAASDLETGKQVMVNGKSNQDGSFSAENIQIRPLAKLQE